MAFDGAFQETILLFKLLTFLLKLLKTPILIQLYSDQLNFSHNNTYINVFYSQQYLTFSIAIKYLYYHLEKIFQDDEFEIKYKDLDLNYKTMDQHEAVHRLVDKIQSALPEIRIRSITSLHTKITVGILDYQLLPKFKKMPGALLNWINDNSTRSEHLFKVLTILSYFAKSEEGLVLLQQYEATQFFKQLRQFLLSQNGRSDVKSVLFQQYTNILENMIKSLLPLHPQTSIRSEESASNIPLEQSKIHEKVDNKKPTAGHSVRKDQRDREQVGDQVRLTWVVSKDPLGKKQEDELYGLFMELRHGKRQLHLQWLKRIHQLVKYWGYKWFRFRADLISELIDQFSKSKLKWLIIDIIRSILRGMDLNSKQLKSGQLELVNVNSPKPVSKPQSQVITIYLRSSLFQSVYSANLIKDILSYQCQPTKQAQIQEQMVYLSFSYSQRYFIQAFSRLLKREKRQLNLAIINRQIEFYFDNYPQARPTICSLVQTMPEDWGLKPQDFPVLVNFLHQTQKSKAYAYISRYEKEWELGSNLHMISDVMGNLEKGIRAVAHTTKKNQLISMYIKCLLTLGVAVEKQDPLMNCYPKIKSFIIQIAQNAEVRATFYQEVLSAINSHSKIRYGSAAYVCSEIALMVFGEDSLFKKLFEEALNEEQACGCWLQASKRLLLTNNLGILDQFTVILYSLSSHKSNQIKEISKFLLQKLSRVGKMQLQLCKLFSTSEEERTRIAIELFKSNYQAVLRELDGQPPEKWKGGAKKLLKIGAQTLDNYIKIIFTNHLEEHIRISAAQQLLESIERIELNQTIVGILIDVSERIRDMLNQPIDRQRSSIVSILLQVRELINQRTKHPNMLKLPILVRLLSEELQPKSIKILLREVYSQVFQSPFHNTPQLHFTILLNPPLKVLSIPVVQSSQSLQPEFLLPTSKHKQLESPNYRESGQLEHFAEWVLQQTINNQKITLDQIFAEIVEKQIGQIIHASKGYFSLHLLLYVFQTLAENQIQISEKISQYSAPLLNSLLAKEIPPLHSEAAAQLLNIIGSRRNRQLTNLLSNGSPGTWKLFLISSLTNLSPETIQQCLKGLLGLHYGREAALILRSLLPHLKRTEVNKFSQSLIVTSCLKYFRQDGDLHLRRIALCVLTELYGELNLPAQGDAQLFASLTAVITEQVLPSEVMALAINLAKLIIQKDSRVIAQATVLKLLLSRLVPLSSTQTTLKVVQASVLQLFRVIVSLRRQYLLAGADLIDLSLPLFCLIEKLPVLKDGQMRLLISGLDILYFSCESQADLPKYLLTSTRLQSQLLRALQIPLQGEGAADFLEAISRLWIRLSANQQDLFVYKISQLLVDSPLTLMQVLATHLQRGGIQYLKMLAWTVIIWSKNRQVLDDQFGQQFSNAILASSQPQLIKLLLPFSLNAKQTFLCSSILIDSLKEANTIIESRIVKDTKERKKKSKPYALSQKESEALEKIFGYLSALFYWNGQGHIEGGEGLRKIVGMLERFYLSGTWQQEVMKHFLRVTTNMGLATPLSDAIAARLAQNGTFVEEIANSIVRAQYIDGTSRIGLRLAASLVHIEPVRTQLLRVRIIQQLSTKLIKSEQRQQINLEYFMETVDLLLTFSAYKDSNIRILGDKRVAEVLVRLLMAGKLSILQEKIVKLLANLACFKHNKPTLMSCKDLHKAILGLLEDSQTPYRSSLLFLLYNLLYKNSAGLKLYRRPEVVELIRSIQVNEGQEVEAIGSALLQALEGCEG